MSIISNTEAADINEGPAAYAPMNNADRILRTAQLAKQTVIDASSHTVSNIQKLLAEMQQSVTDVANDANDFCLDITRIGVEHAERIEKAMLDIAAVAAKIADERQRYLSANGGPKAPSTINGAATDPRAVEAAAAFAAGEIK